MESRRIGEATVRAYLQFTALKLNYGKSPGGDGITLIGTLRNRGQSPALNTEIGGMVGTERPPIESIDPRIIFSGIDSYIAPAAEQGNLSVTIPFKTFLPDEDSGAGLWYLIVIRFRDVFHTTQYAYFRGQFVGSDGKPLSANEVAFNAGGGEISIANR